MFSSNGKLDPSNITEVNPARIADQWNQQYKSNLECVAPQS